MHAHLFRKCLFLLVLFLSNVAYAKTVTMVADPWMPYTGDRERQNGYIVDIAKEIFIEAGYTVEYITLPWSRAILKTREGKYDALISCFKSEAPDFIFPTHEQGKSCSEIFIKTTTTWKFKTTTSLKKMKIGIIKNYSYGTEIDNYVDTNKEDKNLIHFLVGEKALIKGIRMLNAGRIDALIEDKFVAKYTFNSMKLSKSIVSAGQVMEPEKLWIGFSPKKSSSINCAKILSDGMIKIRKDGRLNRILEEYGLSDWKTASE